MPDKLSPVSFQLPRAKSVDAFVVELPGGRTVVRTVDELAPAPVKPMPPAKLPGSTS